MTTLDALLLYEPVQVHSFFNIHLTSLLYLHLGRQFFLFFLYIQYDGQLIKLEMFSKTWRMACHLYKYSKSNDQPRAKNIR